LKEKLFKKTFIKTERERSKTLKRLGIQNHFGKKKKIERKKKQNVLFSLHFSNFFHFLFPSFTFFSQTI